MNFFSCLYLVAPFHQSWRSTSATVYFHIIKLMKPDWYQISPPWGGSLGDILKSTPHHYENKWLFLLSLCASAFWAACSISTPIIFNYRGRRFSLKVCLSLAVNWYIFWGIWFFRSKKNIQGNEIWFIWSGLHSLGLRDFETVQN